jgi:hypothetical protein
MASLENSGEEKKVRVVNISESCAASGAQPRTNCPHWGTWLYFIIVLLFCALLIGVSGWACALIVLAIFVIAYLIYYGVASASNTTWPTKATDTARVYGQGSASSACSSSSNIDQPSMSSIQQITKDLYEPHYSLPKDTDIPHDLCAMRGQDCQDLEYETGFEQKPWCDSERALEKLAVDYYQGAEAASEPRLLPEQCDPQPPLCPLRVAWQQSFKGCPTTFIEAPSCDVYKRDPRLWYRNLNDLIYERSIQAGEIWDPYRHMQARQLWAQFISEDIVNRKDKYARPIGSLEESSCFGRKDCNQ